MLAGQAAHLDKRPTSSQVRGVSELHACSLFVVAGVFMLQLRQLYRPLPPHHHLFHHDTRSKQHV